MSGTDRPDGSEEEFDTLYGYVHWIEVSQVGERDILYFSLLDTSQTQWTFYIYLDSGTTVALAQLQLLRDALASNWYVSVGYMGFGAHTLTPPDPHYPAYSVRISELSMVPP